jgi:chorismate mutase
LNIHEIRDRINQLDDELLRIFNERSALAVKIGEIKEREGLRIYDPTREQSIFHRVQANNPGPLSNQAIVRLFERVVDESRRLERTLAGK